MVVLLACMLVYHMHAWFLQRLENSVIFPGTGVTDVDEPPPYECWKLDVGFSGTAVSDLKL